ncbi:MAG: DUF2807 domain-containing protein [Bacteroidota bacterium]
MKNLLLLLLLLVSCSLQAQVRGNGKLITKNLPAEGLEFLEMGLYANVSVDMSVPAGITITVEENLLPYLNLKVEEGKLALAQTEWIESSIPITIRIGAPDLERIDNSVHETVTVENIDVPEFRLTAFLGKVILSGSVEDLDLSGENGRVDATNLQAERVVLNFWGQGEVLLGKTEYINGIVKPDARVVYQGGDPVVRTRGGGSVMSQVKAERVKRPDARFIKFAVKNNSGRRIQCYVSGPKPDGSRFSYGFPMNPGQTRAKDWSVGSKVYRVTKLGVRKLLVEIKATDEGETVDLFAK